MKTKRKSSRDRLERVCQVLHQKERERFWGTVSIKFVDGDPQHIVVEESLKVDEMMLSVVS